jgi:hypothetical protein
MKFFNSHLSIEHIADAIDNRLPVGERDSFQSHLESCEHCASQYKALAHSINLMRNDRSTDAPPEALNFARNLFRSGKRFVPRPDSVANKILATLKQNVAPFSTVFGERSANASAERQMLFEAGEYDVDLRIRANEKDFNLAGQILGELPEQISLKLQSAGFSRETSISELGEFRIENVPAGNYDLTLQIGETEIVIRNLRFE